MTGEQIGNVIGFGIGRRQANDDAIAMDRRHRVWVR
jgi:hypothetical protein